MDIKMKNETRTKKNASSRKASLKALEKLAFVLEMRAKNSIKEIENQESTAIEKVIPEENIRISIQEDSSLIEYKNNKWQFPHRNFQEYLCARLFARNDFKRLKKILLLPTSKKQFNPKWQNTLTFLISILSNENTKKKSKLLALLQKIEPQLLFKLEPTLIEDSDRYQLFIQHYERTKKGDLFFSTNHQEFKTIIDFGQSRESTKFLWEDIKSKPSSKNLAVNLLSHFKAIHLLDIKEEWKSYLEALLYAPNRENNPYYSAMQAYTNIYGLSEEEKTKLINSFFDSENHNIRYITYEAIAKFQKQDEFINQLLTRQKQIIWTPRQLNEVHSNERSYVSDCLSGISNEESILLFLKDYCEHYLKTNKSNDIHAIEGVLKTAADKMPQNQELLDLLKLIAKEELWRLSYPTNEILHFLDTSNQRLEFSIGIYSEQDEWILPKPKLLAQLANEEFCKFLATEFENEKIILQNILEIQDELDAFGKEKEVQLLNRLVSVNHSIPLPSEERAEKMQKRKDDYQNYKKLIFDKQLFISEAKQIFKGVEKEEIDFSKDYRVIYPRDGAKYSHYNQVVRSTLSNLIKNGITKKKDILNYINTNWEEHLSICLIQEFLMIGQTYVSINEKEKNYIKTWCNRQIKHRVASIEKGTLSRKTFNPRLSWFIRKFHFSHYSKETYLDLLHTVNYPKMNECIFNFVESIPNVSSEDIKIQVLENLKEEVHNYFCFTKSPAIL